MHQAVSEQADERRRTSSTSRESSGSSDSSQPTRPILVDSNQDDDAGDVEADETPTASSDHKPKKKSRLYRLRRSMGRLVTTGSAYKGKKERHRERIAQSRAGLHSGEEGEYHKMGVRVQNAEGSSERKDTWANPDQMSPEELENARRQEAEKVPTRMDRVNHHAHSALEASGGVVNKTGKLLGGVGRTQEEHMERGEFGKAAAAAAAQGLGKILKGGVKVAVTAASKAVGGGSAPGEGVDQVMDGTGKMGSGLLRSAGRTMQRMGRNRNQGVEERIQKYDTSREARQAEHERLTTAHQNVADDIKSMFNDKKRGKGGAFNDSRHDDASNRYMSEAANLKTREGNVDTGRSSEPLPEHFKEQYAVRKTNFGKRKDLLKHLGGIEEAGQASTERQAQKEHVASEPLQMTKEQYERDQKLKHLSGIEAAGKASTERQANNFDQIKSYALPESTKEQYKRDQKLKHLSGIEAAGQASTERQAQKEHVASESLPEHTKEQFRKDRSGLWGKIKRGARRAWASVRRGFSGLWGR